MTHDPNTRCRYCGLPFAMHSEQQLKDCDADLAAALAETGEPEAGPWPEGEEPITDLREALGFPPVVDIDDAGANELFRVAFADSPPPLPPLLIHIFQGMRKLRDLHHALQETQATLEETRELRGKLSNGEILDTLIALTNATSALAHELVQINGYALSVEFHRPPKETS